MKCKYCGLELSDSVLEIHEAWHEETKEDEVKETDREELMKQAEELGIEFSSKTSNSTLAKKVEQAKK